ncbi:MAG TPA: SPFH domain-containing protein [Candidatus Moranbacteria bacterium]|nr:SPFH domain-containing protein [Candidatus Moranbacteria bacterium]HRZ33731.1 SPFH domain-containing protein [Candidatus Moranbacteria bacterium]
MEILSSIVSKAFVPGMILLVVVGIILALKYIASRYKKIPPNAVGVFYGRQYTYTGPAPENKKYSLGFKVVCGGGKVQIPFVENYQEMSTSAFQVEINESSIPNKDNVKVEVRGVATCKLSTEFEDLVNAAQAFLGKSEEEINKFIQNILKGHLRSIIGKLDIQELLRRRDEFNKKVLEESGAELKLLGVRIITLVIQDINDQYGYIDSLGKQTVAEAKRDADIKVAEAQRESTIKVSDAERDASIVTAENAAKVAEANKNRDVKIADMKVITETANAKAEMAKNIELADQSKVLKVKEAERDAAEKEAQTHVQEKEVIRVGKELEATVVMPAEAAKKKKLIDADANKQATITEAEGESKKVQIKAEADKVSQTMEGEGEANKIRATLMASAEGEAAKVEKKLTAEATGTKAMAEALAQMNDASRLIIILDRLPALVDKGGEALAKVGESIFKSVALPFGSIDNIKIVDMGGKGEGLQTMGSIVPQTVANVVRILKTQGIDLEDLFKKAGVNIGEALSMVADKNAGSEEKK